MPQPISGSGDFLNGNPRMSRTRNQIRANDFDLRLYRMIEEARACYTERDGAEQTTWRVIFNALSKARPHIRRMMAEEDRKATD